MKNDIQSSVLVAVDMGSQTFRAMAAEIISTGAIRVLGVEESSLKCCVHQGVVDNTSDAGYMLTNIVKLLGNRIRKEMLNSVFLSVGGRTLKVVSVNSTHDFVFQRDIAPELLIKMESKCVEKIETKNPGVAVLDLIPSYYKLDGKVQENAPAPNQRAVFVEANFNAFVGKKELDEKIKKTFERTPLHLEKKYVRPEALVNALASDEDLEEGCAVLDLGAQTTTLTIYKGGQYLHNQVIPSGGFDITEAIGHLGVSLAQAEHLKCVYGVASVSLLTANRQYVLTNGGGNKITISSLDLANTISNTLDTILSPLMEALNKEAHRLKVLYVTGGGAMLQGVVDYIQTKTSVQVMYGSHAAWLSSDTPDQYCMPCYTSLVGTLLLGAKYRETHPLNHYSKDKRLIDKIKESTLKLFTEE